MNMMQIGLDGGCLFWPGAKENGLVPKKMAWCSLFLETFKILTVPSGPRQKKRFDLSQTFSLLI
jgi:hypothetical protein